MTQVVVVSTLFEAATAAAAVDSDLIGPCGRERILVVTNCSLAPELTPPLDMAAGANSILERFDRVEHLQDLIFPIHPNDWDPREAELPIFARLLRNYWDIRDDPVHLFVKSITTDPARAFSRIFHNSPITVYSCDLASYGPTPSQVKLSLSQRLTQMLYVDIVPGIRPILLSEFSVPKHEIPIGSVQSVLTEISTESVATPTTVQYESRTAIIVGQHPDSLKLLSRGEVVQLYERMARAAAEHGADRIRLKPHPYAPPSFLTPMAKACTEVRAEFELIDNFLPVEAHFIASPPAVVVGCFSTALMTARTIFGIPTKAVDTSLMLERVTPYESSERISLTIVDAFHRESTPYPTAESVKYLIDAVAYCMQPERMSLQRPAAVAFLAAAPPTERLRFFKERRLRALQLIETQGLARRRGPLTKPLHVLAPAWLHSAYRRIRRVMERTQDGAH